MNNKALKYVSFILSLLLIAAAMAGCGSAKYDAVTSEVAAAPMEMNGMAYDAGGGYYAEEDYDYEVMTEEAAAEYEVDEGAASKTAQQQKLIQTIYAGLRTENPAEAMDAVIRYAEETGGYLLSSNNYYDPEDNTGAAYVSVRVPSGVSDQFKAYLTGLGKLENYSTESQDVTNEYYDLKTRIEQRKLEVKQLEELLTECKSVEEVLMVREQLSQVQMDVESMEGMFRRLSELTSYDTITVDILPIPNIVTPGEDGRWMTGNEFIDGVIRGFKKSVRSVVNGAGYFVIFLATAFLPLVAIGLLVWLVVVIVKKIVRKKRAKKIAAAEPEETSVKF